MSLCKCGEEIPEAPEPYKFCCKDCAGYYQAVEGTYPPFNGYTYSVAKPVERLSLQECQRELYGADDWYRDCVACGQGINSKESLRRNEVYRRALSLGDTSLYDWNRRY